MRLPVLALALWVAIAAHAQPASFTTEAEEPRLYALVAAMGNQFTFIHEVESVGSHLAPFRREPVEVTNNELNRLTLRGLDEAIGRTDARSERTFIALTPPRYRSGPLRGQALEDWIIVQLAQMPERSKWDRILVAIPGYRALAREGLPNQLGGMGVFAQPLCQSDRFSCDNNFRPPSGEKAVTPEGETIQASRFVAPYSLVEILVIDPRTMLVVDRGESANHTKMFDPKSDSLDLFRNIERKVLAERIEKVVQGSVAAALADAQGRGTVDVRMRKEVKPEDK